MTDRNAALTSDECIRQLFSKTDDLHLAHVGEDGEAVDVAADAFELSE